MPQPPALDPEGLLLELALRRELIGRQTAQAAINAKANAGGRASIPDLLVRGGFLSSEVVAGLKAEVTAYLNAQRGLAVWPPPGAAPGVQSSVAGGPSSYGSYPPQAPYPSPPPIPTPGAMPRHEVLSSSVSAPPLPLDVDAEVTVVGGLMSTSGTPSRGLPRSPLTTASPPSTPTPRPATLPLPEHELPGGPPSTKPDGTVQATRADVGRMTSSGNFKPVVGAKFGRYELLAELGRGGMGIVFRARQADLEREVALKMLLDGGSASQQAIDRFYAEARHVAKLVHPGIVSIHDVGEQEGIHYFTMDFVEGQHLGQLIRAGKVDEQKCVDISIKLCAALAYAHKQGVIHRDLKPGNILMDKRGSPRITDFGIAKDLGKESTATRAGEVLGTPNYMPPEQADGRAISVDNRADIYSLGAVMYEMLTGRPPFQGNTTFEIVTQVVNQKPPPPRKLVPSIPVDLETIVLKCLEKELDRRYKDATALLKDLERFRAGEPIHAKRPGAITRTLAGAGSHKKALVGSIALVLGAFGLTLYVIDMRQTAERDRLAAIEAAAVVAQKAKEAEELRKQNEHGATIVRDALEAEGRGAFSLAIQRAGDAVGDAPKLALAHETLGRFCLELKTRPDPEGALKEADAALELDASSLEARRVRARALLLQGKPQDALAEAAKVEALGPDAKDAKGVAAALRGEIALQKGQNDSAVRELQEAARSLPKDARVWLLLARAALALERLPDAERAATEAGKFDRLRPTWLLLRAEAREKAGRLREALDDAKQAANDFKDDARARELVARLEKKVEPTSDEDKVKAAERAMAALERKDRPTAEAWLARPRDPTEPVRVTSIRGVLFMDLGRYGDAEAEFTAAIEKDGTNLAYYGNRGLVRLDLGKNDEALADFDAALKKGIPPGLHPAAVGRAKAFSRKKAWAEAEKAFQEALDAAKAPTKADERWAAERRAETIHERAHMRLHQDRPQDAVADLDEALRLHPDHPHYLDVRGDARAKLGDSAGAIEDWKKALGAASPEAQGALRKKIADASKKGPS